MKFCFEFDNFLFRNRLPVGEYWIEIVKKNLEAGGSVIPFHLTTIILYISGSVTSGIGLSMCFRSAFQANCGALT